MTLLEKMSAVQHEYISGKTKHNQFGNFNYRNVEDMLATLKPILKKYNLALTFSETVTAVEGRVYILSSATMYDAETKDKITATAFAREPEEKKGMDVSQITGSATSYARKSALAGLLAVDNGERDPDQDENKEEPSDDLDPERAELLKKIRELNPDAPTKMLKVKNVNYFSELPVEYLKKALAKYQAVAKEANNG